MPERKFSPGFRLSKRDVIVLIIGAAVAFYLSTLDRWAGVAVAFVVAHFFLFCNVLRMPRPLEPLWATTFCATAIVAVLGALTWPTAFVASGVMTVIVAAVQSRRPSYHGIFWRQLNPGLPEWWAAKAERP